jgi:hypothetical protein
MNMQSLQELRNLQKPSQKVEDILAAVIMICKFNKKKHNLSIQIRIIFK